MKKGIIFLVALVLMSSLVLAACPTVSLGKGSGVQIASNLLSGNGFKDSDFDTVRDAYDTCPNTPYLISYLGVGDEFYLNGNRVILLSVDTDATNDYPISLDWEEHTQVGVGLKTASYPSGEGVRFKGLYTFTDPNNPNAARAIIIVTPTVVSDSGCELKNDAISLGAGSGIVVASNLVKAEGFKDSDFDGISNINDNSCPNTPYLISYLGVGDEFYLAGRKVVLLSVDTDATNDYPISLDWEGHTQVGVGLKTATYPSGEGVRFKGLYTFTDPNNPNAARAIVLVAPTTVVDSEADNCELLHVNVSITFEGQSVKLVDVSSTSVVIEVDGVSKIVSITSPQVLNDIEISVVKTFPSPDRKESTATVCLKDVGVPEVPDDCEEYYMGVGKPYSFAGKTLVLKDVSSTSVVIEVDGKSKIVSITSPQVLNDVEISVVKTFSRTDREESTATLCLKRVAGVAEEEAPAADCASKILNINQQVVFSGKKVLLKDVNSMGTSIVIAVNGVSKIVSTSSSQTIKGLEVKLVEVNKDRTSAVVCMKDVGVAEVPKPVGAVCNYPKIKSVLSGCKVVSKDLKNIGDQIIEESGDNLCGANTCVYALITPRADAFASEGVPCAERIDAGAWPLLRLNAVCCPSEGGEKPISASESGEKPVGLTKPVRVAERAPTTKRPVLKRGWFAGLFRRTGSFLAIWR